MDKAAQGNLPEAYMEYVEGKFLRRTPAIKEIAISGLKLQFASLLRNPDIRLSTRSRRHILLCFGLLD